MSCEKEIFSSYELGAFLPTPPYIYSTFHKHTISYFSFFFLIVQSKSHFDGDDVTNILF